MFSIKIDHINILNAPKDRAVVKNISFIIPDNSVYTIFGGNGSGKTTLLKGISQLLNKNIFEVSGEVSLEGTNLFSLSGKELNSYRKNKIKIVFQDAANCFDPLRKLEYYFNLVGKDTDWEEILNKFLLPDKSELMKKYPYEISIGQAQRLNFALAIAANPQIILLDEPTSALDVINNNLFKFIIEDFIRKDNNSILLVTHDIAFAKQVSSKAARLENSTLSEFIEADQIESLYEGVNS